MSDADENVNALSIPCRMDERGVLPAANLSVHRCTSAAQMVPVPAISAQQGEIYLSWYNHV